MATWRFCCPVFVLLLAKGAISLRPNVQRPVEEAAVATQQNGTIDTSGTGASNISRKGHEGTLEMAVMPDNQMTGNGLGKDLENDRNGVTRSIMQQHASLVSFANQLETNPTRAAEIETMIEPILETLENDINEGHAAAEETLKGVTDALAVCDQEWSTERAEQQAPDAAPHLQCRQLEATRKQSFDTCTSFLAVLEISKQNACAAWAQVRDEPPSAYVPPAAVASESFMTYLERVQADVVHQLANGATLKTTCDATTGDYNSKLEECNGLENIWKTAKTDCDNKQAFLESSTCSFTQWADVACSTHATCIENSKALWTLEKSQLQREEGSRKTSYEAMKRISCFFGVFRNSGDGAVDQGGVDRCKEESHDDQHLDLIYPPDPATPTDCSVSELPRPCSSDWTDEAYGSMPALAPIAECTPCTSPPSDLVQFDLIEIPDCEKVPAGTMPATADVEFDFDVLLRETAEFQYLMATGGNRSTYPDGYMQAYFHTGDGDGSCILGFYIQGNGPWTANFKDAKIQWNQTQTIKIQYSSSEKYMKMFVEGELKQKVDYSTSVPISTEDKLHVGCMEGGSGVIHRGMSHGSYLRNFRIRKLEH